MKKKVFCMLLSFFMVFSCLTGCSDRTDNGKDTTYEKNEEKDDAVGKENQEPTDGKQEQTDDKQQEQTDDKQQERTDDVQQGNQGQVSDDKNQPEKHENPEKLLGSKLEEFADSLNELAAKNETVSFENLGLDLSLEVKPSLELLAGFGLEGLEKIGLFLSGDFGRESCLLLSGAINGEKILDIEACTDLTNLFVNLPKYSSSYFMIEMSQFLENGMGGTLEQFTEQYEESMAGMPNGEEIVGIFSDFLTQFSDCIHYVSSEENQTIESGEFSITGTKHTYQVSSDDMQKVLDNYMEAMKQYPALNVQEIERLPEGMKAYIDFYEGADGAFAVATHDEDAEDQIRFFATSKGYLLSVSDGLESWEMFKLMKQTDKKGVFELKDEDGTSLLVGSYDNLSENGVDLNLVIEEVSLGFGIRCDEEDTTIRMNVLAEDTVVDLSLETGHDKITAELSGSYMGHEIGTVILNAVIRDYQKPSIPGNGITSLEEWQSMWDMNSLLTDIQNLLIKYPFLNDLIENADFGD